MADMITKLEAQIKNYAQEYYEGHPTISDTEFDGLIDKLTEINPESEILTTVGWGYDINKVSGTKVNHKYQKVGSLSKIHKMSETTLVPGEYVLSAKLDGLSVVLYYHRGILTRAVTRGNGDIGIDVTDKLLRILKHSANSIEEFSGAIRGELVINKDNWSKICQNHDEEWVKSHNARNYAAGIINRNEITDELDYVNVVVYNVIGCDSLVHDGVRQSYILSFLEDHFENVVPYYVADYTDINDEYLKSIRLKFAEKYPIDGVVITEGYVAYDEYSKAFRYSQIAYKFEAEKAITRVRGISWKLTRTHKLVPTVLLDTVSISGTNVKRATGYNAKYINDNKIDIGSEVEIMKSGEIIPKITCVISESRNFHLPDVCPVCGRALSWNGVDLVCTNETCSNVDFRDLQVWMTTLGSIDGLGWTLMEKFLDEANIESIDDLYKYPIEFDTKNSKQRELFKKSLKKIYSDSVDSVDALCALNIKRLGRASASKIASCEGLLDSMLRCTNPDYPTTMNSTDSAIELENKLAKVVGQATAKAIVNDFDRVKYLNYVADRLVVSKPNNDNNLIKVCITGKLSCPRKDFEVYLKQHGYVNAAISKDTKFLVTDNPDSGSSKNKMADKLGIQKITESEFRSLVEKLSD